MTPHLTHKQLCDLLVGQPASNLHEAGRLELLREHLRDCERCSAELASLSQSLADFRSTTKAWASHEWTSQQASSRSLHPVRPTRSLTMPALWAAAAALVIAATLPLTLHHNGPPSSPPTPKPAAVATQPSANQSDEALLEEIDQTLSSSIPSPMQPLNDPTAGLHNKSNTQRKN
jgi:hypothetical protein